MGKVTINGKTYTGNSVSVTDDIVKIDGKIVDSGSGFRPKTFWQKLLYVMARGYDDNGRIVQLKVEGDLVSVFSEASVQCENVSKDVKAGGSVTAKNIGGGVRANGSVHSGDVGGDVSAGGSVHCGAVQGKVSAGGSIRHG